MFRRDRQQESQGCDKRESPQGERQYHARAGFSTETQSVTSIAIEQEHLHQDLRRASDPPSRGDSSIQRPRTSRQQQESPFLQPSKSPR